jgi:hypothetical protein
MTAATLEERPVLALTREEWILAKPKRLHAGGFAEPSDGLEPSTPSLPCDPNGNRWQPVATVRPRSSHFRAAGGRNVCQQLRPLCSIPVPCQSAKNGPSKTHSWQEYAAWHLGLTEGADEETKAHYAFVYGDCRRLHRMGLIACHYRAAEWRHKEIELAAHELLQYLDRKTGS